MNDLGDLVVKRQEQMAAQRGQWESVWQEIAEHVLPRRADFAGAITPGAKRTQKLFDGTAPQANELLAAALHGMLANPAGRWFQLRTPGAEAGEADGTNGWLEEVTERMTAFFARPQVRFAPTLHELFLDLGAFGTAAMLIDEIPGRGVRFLPCHLAELYLAEDAFGRVDTVYRRFSLTARQLAQRFGVEALSGRVAGALDKEPEKPVEIVHAVFPREERAPGRRDGRNKPFASIHVEAEMRHVLSEAGFDELPYVTPRWSKVPGEIYGRSPAWTVLPDIKMVNAMSKTVIKAAQKVVDPPLLVADDGVILPVRTVPGGLNFGGVDAQGRQLVQPLRNDARIDIGLDMMEQRREAIRAAFFLSILQTPESPVKTATQVLQESDERTRMMGPMVGRMQHELLGPMIARVYGLLHRAGELPPAPEEVGAGPIEVEYVSPVVRAQRAGEVLGVARTVELLAPFAQAEPGLLDLFDADALARHVAEVNGVPAKVIRGAREVAAQRAGRAEVQAGQTALSDAGRTAAVVREAAGALSAMEGVGRGGA